MTDEQDAEEVDLQVVEAAAKQDEAGAAILNAAVCLFAL